MKKLGIIAITKHKILQHKFNAEMTKTPLQKKKKKKIKEITGAEQKKKKEKKLSIKKATSKLKTAIREIMKSRFETSGNGESIKRDRKSIAKSIKTNTI